MRHIKTVSKLTYQNRRKLYAKRKTLCINSYAGAVRQMRQKGILTYNAATPKFIVRERYAAVYVDVYVEEGYDCFAVIPRCSLRERAIQLRRLVNVYYI